MSLQQKNSTVLVKHGLLMASTLAAEATKAEGTASILWTAVVNMYYWGDNYKMQTSHTLCSRPKRYGALHGRGVARGNPIKARPLRGDAERADERSAAPASSRVASDCSRRRSDGAAGRVSTLCVARWRRRKGGA